MSDTPGQWRVGLLGPVEVTVPGGRPHTVAGRRRKALLALLALHPGQVVSADRLIDIVWDGAPPATAQNTLQSHISWLRGAPAVQAPIVARPPGYMLDVPATAIDVTLAERLIRGDGRAERLREALGLWRGKALADITGSRWFDDQAARLEDLRLDAVEALVDARLSLGEHARLLPELEELIAKHPFREHFHRQLMLALYACGRQVDALAVFRRLRQTLQDELGIDPGRPLRDLELAILRQDSNLTRVAARPQVPAQLPPSLPVFAGREAELACLNALLSEKGQPPGAVLIAAISGTAGVGKTALALRWAHAVAARYPDGQLYADLHGFDPSGAAASPEAVLLRFLQALGAQIGDIPAGLDARASLLRTLLARKKVLVLLDNAGDAEQVRPLLPGAPGCLVLVTSRNRLQGLVIGQGARPLHLEPPSHAEARAILLRHLGGRSAEPATLDTIVAACARLPLALAIAAGRVTSEGVPLAELARRLGEASRRRGALEAFRTDDPATDARAVISASVTTLKPEAAQLFRALGGAGAPGLELEAIASAAGIAPARARTLLADLSRVNLVDGDGFGRYELHHLYRAYVRELRA